MTFDELYRQARWVLNPRKLSETAEAGGVGADRNGAAEVMIGENQVVRLRDLLPYDWREMSRAERQG